MLCTPWNNHQNEWHLFGTRIQDLKSEPCHPPLAHEPSRRLRVGLFLRYALWVSQKFQTLRPSGASGDSLAHLEEDPLSELFHEPLRPPTAKISRL